MDSDNVDVMDQTIEDMWDELTDIPFDEDEDEELVLATKWKWFEKGTPREDIWRWFDKHYSKGVAALMYRDD